MPIGTSADGLVCTAGQFSTHSLILNSTLSLMLKALPGHAARPAIENACVRYSWGPELRRIQEIMLNKYFLYLRLACLSACALGPLPSMAAPEEIQVYLDEFADRGKFELDFHTNYVMSADSGATTRNMLRVTPELSYGINENWEGALYWLTSAGPEQESGRPVSDGFKVRLKWRPRAPSADSPWYWAVNFEVGELASRFYPDKTSGEIKFIGVWKSGRWTLGGNLNLDRSLRSDSQQGTTADIDGKMAYRVSGGHDEGLQLGIEHYAGLGQFKNLYASDERVSMTFLVADFEFKDWEFNIGLGRATGATQDNVILKAIIGVPL
jgi:hypothetical protein